ncbi:serine/threonine-protein kinase [Actinophytocola algeriensis]|uniref:non-specific serine/threonine protein kinase n=1 Tax=Actinophytocola algeriensis TaxID=1768010 RepID=A0A7W7Q910_9PSEU|nr:serine/threonine-protein kinase [Actinophytocola algeriensis]MBB4909261.1 serine/threonine-protein kinase PknG [Actinophytocola algeriensis]MBE1474351.1 serine/threonine-protein kinase PknG [Actinophytocola algeriensis]
MTQCPRTGCGGTLDEDGFCGTCGLEAPAGAAAATPSTPAAAPSPPPPPTPASIAAGTGVPGNCPRPGCAGTLDEDGFCDSCGLEAPEGTPVPAPAAAAPDTEADSARTVSTRTGSVATGWTASTGAVTTSSRRGSARSSSRGLLGAGLVEIPRVPYRDPKSAILAHPKVPENKRFCSNCGAKVGRGRDGQPGRTEGFCTSCRRRFSFSPKLSPGEVLHDQYEVLGCLAHGGLGWIYLALDRAVADRWVVMKGLLDTGDTDAMAAAVAERRFLAEVEHPNIVKIHNFVQHPDADTGALVGYIVMEYVGGQSIKEMLKDVRAVQGTEACLPLSRAIAYTLEMLPPIGYLHTLNLLFCDFKPDNVIQTEEQLKLIDLGAVRHMDDDDSAVYGTVGYQAPEIATAGPSIASDLYTIGRTLAVMTFPFDFQRAYVDRLPNPAEEPLLAEHDSYHRFLLRAAAQAPQARFTSAEEMKDQLTGVLREVLAAEDGMPRPGASAEFTPERRSFGIDVAFDAAESLPSLVHALPVPRVDGTDPSAAFLATVTATEPAALADELRQAPKNSVEVRLRLVRALLEAGDVETGRRKLDELVREVRDLDRLWLVDWYRGVAALASGDAKSASQFFDRVYSAVPGEAAPKLALAVCAEAVGDHATADRYHRVVWRTDRTYVTAAFGLARALLARGGRLEAFDVLCSVPETSNHHTAARLAAADVRVRNVPAAQLAEDDLTSAGALLSGLELHAEPKALAGERLLTAAFEWVTQGGRAGGTVLGCPLRENDLRVALEETYRTLARHADNTRERIALVDSANQIRPTTWV